MIESLCTSIVKKLNAIIPFSDIEAEKMLYSLTALLNDFSKMIILLILWKTLGNTKLFMIAFLFSTLLRITIGGFHFKKYWSCLIFSLFYYCLIIFLNSMPINRSLIITLFVISQITIIIFAPITSKQRENVRKFSKKKYKIGALFISIIFLLFYITKNNPHTQIGLWIIIVQSLLLLFMKGMSIFEKNNYKKVC